jgi:hypothetical protein
LQLEFCADTGVTALKIAFECELDGSEDGDLHVG